MGKSFIVVFAGRNGQGWVSRLDRLGLASLNNFSRLQDVGTVPNCLVPGPGVIKTGGYGSSCEA